MAPWTLLRAWIKRAGKSLGSTSPTEALTCPHGALAPGKASRCAAVPPALWDFLKQSWEEQQRKRASPDTHAKPAAEANGGVRASEERETGAIGREANADASPTGQSPDAADADGAERGRPANGANRGGPASTSGSKRKPSQHKAEDQGDDDEVVVVDARPAHDAGPSGAERRKRRKDESGTKADPIDLCASPRQGDREPAHAARGDDAGDGDAAQCNGHAAGSVLRDLPTNEPPCEACAAALSTAVKVEEVRRRGVGR